jgi:sarcosine oxidase
MKRRDFLQSSAGMLSLGSIPDLGSLHDSVTDKLKSMSASTEKHFDVIVLGVGSMGSATCFQLAKQGVKVLGLEQFDIPHELGSHAGQSRIIRKAYFEHPDYVPLLVKAYENWKELENAAGSQVYFKTGLLYAGKKDNALMKGVRESAELYKVKVDDFSVAEAKKKHSQFDLPVDYDVLFEPDAGFVTPERAILLFTEQAIKKGAVIRTKEKIKEWKKAGNEILVKTQTDTYTCKKLVISAGPWAGKMIPGLESKLTITRQMIAWVNPKNWKLFELGNFPCWIIADDAKPGAYYGFPIVPVGKLGGPIGLKLAHHYQGTITDPDAVNRAPAAEDEANLVYALNKFFPEGYSSTLVMKTCLYTNTPDENFILDFLPGYDNVIIATGFSGHGFKFASVVGEIMADLSLHGKTSLPIGFLNAKRYA